MSTKQKKYNERFIMKVKSEIHSSLRHILILDFELWDTKTRSSVYNYTAMNSSYHRYCNNTQKYISYESKKFEKMCKEQVKQLETLEKSFKEWI